LLWNKEAVKISICIAQVLQVFWW